MIKRPERQIHVAYEDIAALQEAKDVDPSIWQAFLERLTRFVDARIPSGSRDDVVGDILLKLIKHRQQLAATSNPFAWMTRVAANAVADHHRRRASEQRAMVAYASDPLLSDGLDEKPSDNNLASDDLAGCVLPFVERLPKPYQEALTLVEIDGLSQRAAAAKLGLSVSGLKSRVQRGRQKLKEAILRCCTVQLDRRGGIMEYHRRGASSTKPCCNHPP